MWDNFEVLQEEEVFNDTFSINTVFRIKSGSGAVSISFVYEFDAYK